MEGIEGVDQMIFRLRGKDVNGRSAIEVVRALERDNSEYCHGGGQILSREQEESDKRASQLTVELHFGHPANRLKTLRGEAP